MPHGLTIDSEGFYWITDVALHQVRIFPTLKRISILNIFDMQCHSKFTNEIHQ